MGVLLAAALLTASTVATSPAKVECRVEWVSVITGASGHGSWISKETAEAAAASANGKYPKLRHAVVCRKATSAAVPVKALAMPSPTKTWCRVEWRSPHSHKIQVSDWTSRKTAELWTNYGKRRHPDANYRFYCWQRYDV